MLRGKKISVPICKIAFPDVRNFNELSSEITEVIDGNPCITKARKNFSNCMYQRGREYCKERYKSDIENCPTHNHPSIKCTKEFLLYDMKHRMNPHDPADQAKAFIDLHGMTSEIESSSVGEVGTAVPIDTPKQQHFPTPVPIDVVDDSFSQKSQNFINNLFSDPNKVFSICFCVVFGILVIALLYHFIFKKKQNNNSELI